MSAPVFDLHWLLEQLRPYGWMPSFTLGLFRDLGSESGQWIRPDGPGRVWLYGSVPGSPASSVSFHGTPEEMRDFIISRESAAVPEETR